MDASNPDFRFSMPLNIRWNDMDALGHVNNVYYFDYFQNARGFYMPTVSKKWDWTKYMFVIAHIECDYFKELNLLSKNPHIKARTSRLGNKSFEIEYLVVSEAENADEILHAKGKSTQVMIDILKKKTIEIPEWLKSDLMEFESQLKH